MHLMFNNSPLSSADSQKDKISNQNIFSKFTATNMSNNKTIAEIRRDMI